MKPNNDALQLMRPLYRGGNFGYYWRSDNKQSTWFECKNPAQLPTSENLYFGVHPTTKRKAGRSTTETVQLINCLFAEFDAKDFDNDKDKALNHILDLELNPSALIDSGGGYHAYWFLAEPVFLDDDNREEIRELQARFVETMGGDPGAKDLARVLRIPGTYNTKYNPARLVDRVWIDPENTFTLTELENLTKPDIRAEKPAPKPSHTFSGGDWPESLAFWTTKALERARPGNRDNTGFWLASQLRDAGLTMDQAISSNYPENVPQTKDKYTRKDYERTVKSAYSGGRRDPARSARNGAYMSNTQPTPPPPDNDDFWEEIEKGTTELKILPAVERVKIKPVESSQNEMINYVPGKALTDLGNAERLITLYGADLKYSNELKNFLTWSGARWVEDNDGQARRLAQNTAKTILIESYNEEDKSLSKKIGQWAFTSQSKNKLDSMLDLAKSQPGITVPITEFDRNEYKLNFLNGTLDLTTGTLQPHNPLDLITKQIQLNYDPDAECPLWLKFLDEIMDHDQDLINYLQRSIGYSLTGDTGEQCLFVAHGNGSNGKTVFTQTILKALGDDYTKTARPETILTKDRSSGGATPDLARLRGARYVSINEIASSRRLDEARVKEMTGSDQITARFLFSEEFSYTPSFKLWISTNHKPIIKDVDEGIWRRMRLIPFTVKIPENKQDIKLIQKLESEYAGIIAWAVQGCLQWQESGLQTPEKVTQATELYRTEEDLLQPFFDDKCVIDENIKTMASDLYKSYKAWCEENSEKATNTTRFGRMLSDRGFEKTRLTAGNFWQGIGLRE
jgi:putative DNA primase/helicase